jgi:hypothetical protein
MRRLFICFGLLAALPLLWPAEAVGQKKNAPKLETTTDQDYAAVRKLKEITGVLTELDPEAKTLTLRVEYFTYEPLPMKANNQQNQQYNNLVRQQQRLMNEYQSIMNARNPAQQQQRMARFQRDYQNFVMQAQRLGVAMQPKFKTVPHAKEVEFDLSPELKVARAKPPMQYDDKGNVKEYTKEELKKMRSADMPGYTAAVDDLQAGQTVKLYLGRPKAKKKSPGESDKTDEPAKKASEPDLTAGDGKTTSGSKGADEKKAPERAFVRMILIQTDADPSFQKTKKKR